MVSACTPASEDETNNAQAATDCLDSSTVSIRLTDPSASVQDALAGRLPPDDELLWATDATGRNTEPYVVQRRELISELRVLDAAAGFAQRNAEPVVNV